MSIPKPPWYTSVEKKLEGKDDLINLVIVAIILLSIYLLIKGDNVQRLAWAVYLISP